MASSSPAVVEYAGQAGTTTPNMAHTLSPVDSAHNRASSMMSADAVSTATAESNTSSKSAPAVVLAKARKVKSKVKSKLHLGKNRHEDGDEDGSSDDDDDGDHEEDGNGVAIVEDDDDAPLAVVRDRSMSSSSQVRKSSINSKTAAQVYAERHRLEGEDDLAISDSPGAITPHAQDYSDDDDDQNIIVLSSGKKQVVELPLSGGGTPSRASSTAFSSKPFAPGTPLSAKAIKSPPGTANTVSTGGRSRGRSSISLPASQSDWKRRAEFHNLFEGKVDEDEHLISDYTCAWAKDILRHGRIYVGARSLAFICTIIGLKCSLVIPYVDIAKIEKAVTARVIPNAISITTVNGDTSLFCSFVYRDTSYDLIMDCWRSLNPEAYNSYMKSLEVDTTDDGENQDGNGDATVSNGNFSAESDKTASDKTVHPATECSGNHFSETVLDVRYPSEPEKMFNLIYRSEDFQRKINDDLKLTDYQSSGWKAQDKPGKDGMQTREHSYVKPLNGSVGPSSAKCLIFDEELVKDAEKAFEILSVTKTPDVPSGGSFSVHTKTCLTWAGGAKGGCRMLVTTECVWTSRSMLKGVITSSSIAGQREYNKELAKFIRKEIHAHPDQYASGDAIAQEADDELAADSTDKSGESQSNILSSADGRTSSHFRPFGSLISTVQTSQAATALLLLSNIALLAFFASSLFTAGWPGRTVAVNKVVLSPDQEALALQRLQSMEQSWQAFQVCVKHLVRDAA